MRSRSAWSVVIVGLLSVTGCSGHVGASLTGASASLGAQHLRPAETRIRNVYAAAGPHGLRPEAASALTRVYVPNSRSNTVSVIDPGTMRVVGTFPVGDTPQHVVPSFDLRTLWVNNDGSGSLTPIDAVSGKPGRAVVVSDPYNLYFTPDGADAIVVAEARRRLDFRDPHTMALRSSLPVPCAGANHLDFSDDGGYFLVSCEFADRLLKVETATHRLVGTLPLPHPGGMPQDVRLAPDGSGFFVADMVADGVWLIDGDSLRVAGFIPTGIGAHGVYPSRDGTRVYVTNRGSHRPEGRPHGPGSVSVVDVASRTVVATWPVPGGGSPDMGSVSADGRRLWLAGRYDDEVYVFDTDSGALAGRIPVGHEPHGLTIWPQPGRFSLGHTGNMR